MNRAEFLEILREQLSGQMHEGKMAAHLRYYEDYIQSQVQKGIREEDVLQGLGDPRLIAKTLIDREGDSLGGNYEEYSSGGGYDGGQYQESGVKRTHRLDLTTWYGKLMVIVAAAVLILLMVTVIGAVLPFFLILFAILFLISYIKKRRP
ncbi:MAG: DUF1700 domain-containing protein [Eubacteriales bacterium]|nr:DUF1700 domain-containing protein [Eubacteriales bacterium]